MGSPLLQSPFLIYPLSFACVGRYEVRLSVAKSVSRYGENVYRMPAFQFGWKA
jgi:hypothetical protein